MDFTLSPQHVVHPVTGYRMHDDNQAIPTMVTDNDFNQVIWSLMALLNQAGLSPAQFNPADPASYTKVLTAVATLNRRCYGSVAPAAGTADAITASFDPPVIALTDGLHLRVRAAGANTSTAPTLKVGGLDAKVICKGPGLSLDAGDIHGAGHWLNLQFDALLDMWVLLNPANGISAVPTGMVLPFLATSAPAGWLKGNGAVPSIASVPRLASVIYCGDANNATAEWGYRCTNPASPTTTRSTAGTYIVLPDMRAEFLRGWDDSRGKDAGRSMWSWQKGSIVTGEDVNPSNSVNVPIYGGEYAKWGLDNPFDAWVPGLVGAAVGGGTNFDISQGSASSTNFVLHAGMTRPRNLAVLFCIKA